MDRFDQITTFVRVVELGGFAAAARDLGVAPSLVTTHIQALEQRLGARLLNRNTRHVKPTEVGEAYYKYCVDVISRFDEAEALVESMQAKPRGVLRLNTSVLIANLITPVIVDYTAQFPEVSVRLIATGRPVDFIEEQFDVSIRHQMPENESLIVRKLAEYDLVVCASPNYLVNRPRPETPADLVGHNCILYTDSGYGDRWPVFESPQEIAVKGNLQTNSPLVLLGAAEAGEGIVVLPRFLAADALGEGRLIGLLSEHTTVRRSIHAIYPHRELVPTKAAVFVDMVAAHLLRVLAPARSEPARRSAVQNPPSPALKTVRRTPAPAGRTKHAAKAR
jgi:DNA-binding transcriptional LysR family regulator